MQCVAVHFPDRLRLRWPRGRRTAIEMAAAAQNTTPSEWSRRALLQGLQADRLHLRNGQIAVVRTHDCRSRRAHIAVHGKPPRCRLWGAPHTVGMLNRAINGKRRDPKKRQALLATLKRVLENPQADSMTRSRAFDYLEFQNAARQTFLNYPNNLPQGLAARTHLPCQKRKSPPCWRVVGRWSGFGVEL